MTSFGGITLANAINIQYEFGLKYYSSYGFIKVFTGEFSMPWQLISCAPCLLIWQVNILHIQTLQAMFLLLSVSLTDLLIFLLISCI